MNISKKLFAASLFVAPLLVFSTTNAHAVEQDRDDTASQPQAVLAHNDEHVAQGQLSDEQKAALKQRIEKLKTNLKTRLSATEKRKIQDKCKAAQGNVSSVSGRVKGIETSREQVYTNLMNRLNGLKDKLKERGADVAQLEANLTELQTLIDTYKTDLDAYKHALEDLAAQDCTTDPEGFKAALETARAAAKKVRDDGKAIKAYLSETVKPTLRTIRDSLPKEEDGSQTDGGTEDSETQEGGSQ